MRKFLFFTSLMILLNAGLQAQWDGNPATVNNPVSNAATADTYGYAVTDGAGGVIAVWEAYDAASNTDRIYCQRKTSAGAISWGTVTAPVQLFSADHETEFIGLVDLKADGSGGAYISWAVELDTAHDIYLQHISSSGIELFTAGDIKIRPARGHYTASGRLCADAAGVIITWSEQELPAYGNIIPGAQVFVQRYNASGVPQWGAGGVPISSVPGSKAISELVSDGNNGAFIAFTDARNASFDQDGNANNLDIFAQHISSTGARLWPAQDAVVSTSPSNQYTTEGELSRLVTAMISDNADGFIIVYDDYQLGNEGYGTMHAQRLNGNGQRLWGDDGVPLYTPDPTIFTDIPQVISDGANGLVTLWASENSNGGFDILAQRITGTGFTAWGPDGTIVNDPDDIYADAMPTLAADGEGFYIVAWIDIASSTIKGQKLSGAGHKEWASEGVDICTNQLSSPYNVVLTKSVGTSMILIWEDWRNQAISGADLYAAKINGDGSLVNTAVTTYTTIANGNWNNPAIWAGGVVPVTGADVIIKTAVIANVDVTCNTLTVQSPGSLTVAAGVNITVLH